MRVADRPEVMFGARPRAGTLQRESESVPDDWILLNLFQFAVLWQVKLTIHGRSQNEPQGTGTCPGAPDSVNLHLAVLI
jgi:hypothetical protein